MDTPLSVRRYARAYAKVNPGYRQRNAKIYDQARTMSRQEIAEYWRLDAHTVKDILKAEIKRRSDNPTIPA